MMDCPATNAKVAYMGTTRFSRPSLAKIMQSGHGFCNNKLVSAPRSSKSWVLVVGDHATDQLFF